MKRILVFEYLTGGGEVDGGAMALRALLPQGLAMRDAMVADLLRAGDVAVTAAGCDVAPPPPAGAASCRVRAAESVFEMVTREAARHDAVWLVAPETDGLLARFRACVPAGHWLGCDAVAIRLASSKRATLAQLAAHGLCTPLAFADEATRWVVKPDDGAGAVDTRVHDSLAGARAAQRAAPGSRMTLEPWVDGQAMSLSLMCSDGGAELLSINRQRVAVGADGTLAYGGVDIDHWPRHGAVGQAAATLATQLPRAIAGLRGFVGIDLVWHATHGPVVIEVNPRITCAYVGLSVRLGRNLAAEVLADHARERRRVDA